jgi:hypothetical protein
VFGKGEEMAFNFSSSIPVSQQREQIEELIPEALVRIYRAALSFGIDPETLTEDWEPGEEFAGADMTALTKELDGYALLKRKLDNLPS